MDEALKNIQQVLGSLKTVDRKAGVSEKRKVNMKWCEERRKKLQRDYDDLLAANNALLGFNNYLVAESQRLTRVSRNATKMLSENECNDPLPPDEDEATTSK